jgi:hypothetical protein
MAELLDTGAAMQRAQQDTLANRAQLAVADHIGTSAAGDQPADPAGRDATSPRWARGQ